MGVGGKPQPVPNLVKNLSLLFLPVSFEIRTAQGCPVLQGEEIVHETEIESTHLPHERFVMLVGEIGRIDAHRVDTICQSGIGSGQANHPGITLCLTGKNTTPNSK